MVIAVTEQEAEQGAQGPCGMSEYYLVDFSLSFIHILLKVIFTLFSCIKEYKL